MTAAAACAALALTSCALSQDSQPRASATRPPINTPAVPPSRIDALLPIPRAELATAVQFAARFITSYGSYRYDQAPQTQLERLRPLVTPELYAALARSTASPGQATLRARQHQVATATATPIKIRAIGPVSLVLVIDLHQAITTSIQRYQRSQQLAVTTIRNSSGRWRVHDLQPADAGDHGDLAHASP